MLPYKKFKFLFQHSRWHLYGKFLHIPKYITFRNTKRLSTYSPKLCFLASFIDVYRSIIFLATYLNINIQNHIFYFSLFPLFIFLIGHYALFYTKYSFFLSTLTATILLTYFSHFNPSSKQKL